MHICRVGYEPPSILTHRPYEEQGTLERTKEYYEKDTRGYAVLSSNTSPEYTSGFQTRTEARLNSWSLSIFDQS